MKNPRNTLSQVMNQLEKEGYDGNTPTDDIKTLNSSEWIIDDIHRFEGNSNPADNSILYAISKKNGTEKKILINAYGTGAEKEVNTFVKKLEKSFE